MMRLSNESSSSLGSNKDKDLPPIPPKKADDDHLLQAKTLKRKNFKKLSLTSPPTTSEYDYDEIPDDFKSTSLLQKRNNLRPAPLLLNLKPNNNSITVNDNSIIQDFNGSGEEHSIINQMTNLDLSTTTLKAPSSTSTLLAPETQTGLKSTTVIRNDPTTGTSTTTFTRKRQTIISSISPTKSTASSPSDIKAQSLHFAASNNNNNTSNLSPISTSSTFKLNINDLLTLKNLGSGNSGTVSKILHIPTQKIMAKKVIPIDSETVIQAQIIRELRILHECRSPYIIEFYGAFINNNNTIVICMEYCNCGSLDKILSLSPNGQFPLPILKKLAFSILSGLSYLYTTHKIIHRDIKPSNVLMSHKGEFKLCDFGVSRELNNSIAMADTFVGTSTYMSPERIQGLTYGVKSDVWSMGLMLIELASGKPVWYEDTKSTGPEGILDLLQRIVNETPPSLTNKVNPITKTAYDPSLCQFIDFCLIKDDNVRKSPSELLDDTEGFLKGTIEGLFDKDVKVWAKGIRKLLKDKSENDK
ncbi:kinase-like domain-containing protein [Scheffersomyces coipomensis]|uniref:kinase-like domain-containing protein n=1 Tax=Scheffersomyces coipomensis TaxID=1788519 RepID=UPI00315DEB6B